MPIYEQKNWDESFGGQPLAKDVPTTSDAFRAAFEQENDIVALGRLLNEPRFTPDPEFDFTKRLRESPYYLTHADALSGADSDAEFQYIEQRIGQEIRNRQVLGSAGAAGVIGGMVAGTLSPTVLLPIAGAARGVKGVATAFGYAALGGVGQETVLLASQETRTREESALNIGMQTVVGGLLGSAAVALRPGELEEIARRMDVTPGETSILPAVPPGSAGAMGTQAPGAGRLKYGDRLDIRTLAHIGPVTETINSDLAVASREMAKLDDAGVMLEGYGKGLQAQEGGTVNARIISWNGVTAKALRFNDEMYAKYAAGDRSFAQTRANVMNLVPGAAKRAGKLTRQEWNRQVSDIYQGIHDGPTIPEAKQVADLYREEFFNHITKTAIERGLYKGIEEIEDFLAKGIKGEEVWLHRVYNEDMIRKRQAEWIAMWTAHIERKMTDSFREQYTKLTSKEKIAEQDIKDLQMPREQAEELIAQLSKGLDEEDKTNPFQVLEDQIKEAQIALREAQAGKAAPDEIDRLRAAYSKLKEDRAANQDYQDFAKPRGENRRRLRVLRRGRGNLERRKEEALERIDKLEEQNLESLKRVLRQGRNLLNKMDKLDDEVLDAEMAKLKKSLDRAAETYAKTEKRAAELATKRDLQEFVAEQMAAGDAAPTTPVPASVKEAPESVSTIKDPEVLKEWPGPSYTLVDAQGQRWVLQRGTMEIDLRGWSATPVDKNWKQIGEMQYVGDRKKDAIANVEQNGKSVFESSQLDQSGRKSRYVREPEQVAPAQPDYSEAMSTQAKLESLSDRADAQYQRLQRAAERVVDAEAGSREAARGAVEEAIDTLAERVNGVTGRRVQREVKLRERAERLDPERATREADAIAERMGTRREAFIEKLRQVGVGDYELGKGEYDFRLAAQEVAQTLTGKILSWDKSRMVGMDLIGEERGAMLARYLDMDIQTPGFKEFLERDIDKLARIYARHMVPDIEIHRATGSVNGVTAIDRMTQEFKMRHSQILQDLDKAGTPLKTPRTVEQKNKAADKLLATFERDKRNYEIVVSRLRNQRGVPGDAASIGYRLGKLARNLNTLRMMGTVAISSVADPARPVMKYGLVRTFRDGFLPMITNFKQFQRHAELARFSGTANDAIMHTRAQHINDIIDDYSRGTAFENGIQWMANRMGTFAMFDQWTQGGKFLTAGVVNSLLWDSLEAIHRGGTKMKADKALEFLDSVGVSDRLGRRMLEMVEAPGGGLRGKNGRWLPNAEDWAGEGAQEARWAYQAAMNKSIDDTIITPGPERPKWVDENEAFRVIAQFRSFAFASTTKMMMAGLQQRDMALLNGMMVSLALGAVSYYLWAITTGGKAREEMLNADIDKWADEAIDRSGLLGILAEARRIGERVPYVRDMTTFSGQRTSRRAGEDLIAAILGPSFDLGKRTSNVIMGLDEPTEATVHNLRLVWPLQNVWYLRQAMDQVESGLNSSLGIPKERSK